MLPDGIALKSNHLFKKKYQPLVLQMCVHTASETLAGSWKRYIVWQHYYRLSLVSAHCSRWEWGSSFYLSVEILSRFCSSSISVNSLNAETGLRWCDLLPHHFLWWVLGSYWPTSLSPPPSLVVSDIDLMGWSTAAVFCDWVLLSLHTQQQQQDSIASNTSAELVDELEFREIVGYLEFKIFTYMSFFWLPVVPLDVSRMPKADEM